MKVGSRRRPDLIGEAKRITAILRAKGGDVPLHADQPVTQ
jgi:hypothetical protein